jgi:predicted nucleotidyltransferase/HEPN domain-containing protein
MKTTLPAKSKDHQEKIQEIADIIVKIGKDKIAFVILFGSFARGDWVYHTYQEDGIIYNYASDYDILIITKAKKHASLQAAYKLEDKIEQEINKRELDKKHSITLVIESLDKVNSELEKDRYFFSDIKKEGILLYSSGEFELSNPKKLSTKEIKEIAAENYKHWFESGEDFLNTAPKFKQLSKSAFSLHQAAESFYHCTLLVLTGYKHKTHDLEKLGKLCAAHSNKFLTIFPQTNKEQSKCFKLLKAAYIEARYNKDYKISKEQLGYLIERVEVLQKVVGEICHSKILLN